MKGSGKIKPILSPRKYVASSGCKCPSCFSGNLSADTPQIDGPSVWVGVSCNDCGASWNDVYKLVGYEELEFNTEVQPMKPFSLTQQ